MATSKTSQSYRTQDLIHPGYLQKNSRGVGSFSWPNNNHSLQHTTSKRGRSFERLPIGFSLERFDLQSALLHKNGRWGQKVLSSLYIQDHHDGDTKMYTPTGNNCCWERWECVTCVVPPREASTRPAVGRLSDAVDGCKQPQSTQRACTKHAKRRRWRFFCKINTYLYRLTTHDESSSRATRAMTASMYSGKTSATSPPPSFVHMRTNYDTACMLFIPRHAPLYALTATDSPSPSQLSR